jgi:hypothetical protein
LAATARLALIGVAAQHDAVEQQPPGLTIAERGGRDAA